MAWVELILKEQWYLIFKREIFPCFRPTGAVQFSGLQVKPSFVNTTNDEGLIIVDLY